MHSVKNNLHRRLDDLFHHHALSSSRYHLLYRNILYLLAEAPGVAVEFKKSNFERNFSLCFLQSTHGIPKKMSALSVQPFGQI